VLRPDLASEVSMFPWMIEMIMGIVSSALMSDPNVRRRVNVWRIRVIGTITIRSMSL
jgi:hypothetical protein